MIAELTEKFVKEIDEGIRKALEDFFERPTDIELLDVKGCIHKKRKEGFEFSLERKVEIFPETKYFLIILKNGKKVFKKEILSYRLGVSLWQST